MVKLDSRSRVLSAISGEVVLISGQAINISGQVTTSVSGNIVQISGQIISVITNSGQYVVVSGVATSVSGNVVQISGQGVITSVSGNIVQISGQAVATSVLTPTSVLIGTNTTANPVAITSLSGGQTISSGVIISVVMKALLANSGDIYVGGSGNRPFSGYGFLLSPGDTLAFDINNFNGIYTVTAISGDRISYLGTD